VVNQSLKPWLKTDSLKSTPPQLVSFLIYFKFNCHLRCSSSLNGGPPHKTPIFVQTAVLSASFFIAPKLITNQATSHGQPIVNQKTF